MWSCISFSCVVFSTLGCFYVIFLFFLTQNILPGTINLSKNKFPSTLFSISRLHPYTSFFPLGEFEFLSANNYVKHLELSPFLSPSLFVFPLGEHTVDQPASRVVTSYFLDFQS